MNWKDRLTSLMLGEDREANTPITGPLMRRRSRGEVAYDMNIDTAAAMGAGGRGTSRGKALGREVHDIDLNLDDFKKSMRRRMRLGRTKLSKEPAEFAPQTYTPKR